MAAAKSNDQLRRGYVKEMLRREDVVREQVKS